MANHPVNTSLSKYLVRIGLILLQALIATSCLTSLFAQDTLRVATYNLLFFPGMDGNPRIPHFRTVMNASRPDVLVVQELESQAGLNIFLSDVLNHDDNLYQASPFIDGPFTDSALFLNQNKVALQGLLPVPNTPFRNVMEYFLTAFGEEFIIDTLAGDLDHANTVHKVIPRGTNNQGIVFPHNSQNISIRSTLRTESSPRI